MCLLAVSKINKNVSFYPLIEIAYAQFPLGSDGCAPCEKKFWDIFIETAVKEWVFIDLGVLRDKGDDFWDWFCKYAEPEIRLKNLLRT